MQSEERFKKYQEYLEANFKKASEGEKPAEAKEFSSEEAKEFVKGHNAHVTDKKEYEDTLYSTIAVPVAKLMPDGEEVMCMEISEGLVKGVMIESVNDKTAKVFIKDDATYSVQKHDGTTKEMKGSDIAKSVTDSAKEAISKVAGRRR